MAWHQSRNKPLPEQMRAYCELDLWEQIFMKFESKYNLINIGSGPQHPAVTFTSYAPCYSHKNDFIGNAPDINNCNAFRTNV